MSELLGRFEKIDFELMEIKNRANSATLSIINAAVKLEGKLVEPEKNWKEIAQLARHIKDVAETLKGFCT